jgi:hypothetical protein
MEVRRPTSPSRDSQRGQAAIESALVLPLFMFLLLGALQLSLMHQARILAKYAAYKAARVGALTSADHTRMERAALAVLLPTIKHKAAVFSADTATKFAESFAEVMLNQMPEGYMQYVEIKICSPTKDMLGSGNDVDFDSETTVASTEGRTDGMDAQGWKDWDRGRLSIQLTYNYRMVIPFADMMLYYVFTGQERAEEMRIFRLGTEQTQHSASRDLTFYNQLADQGVYVFPIRSNFAMRMQSNLFPGTSGHELPQSNDCIIRFPKQGSSGGGGDSSGIQDGVDDNSNVAPPGG